MKAGRYRFRSCWLSPIGVFGAILALYFKPLLSNNVYAQIGLITLIGLSAKMPS